jgi:PHP family Zn ribbon phosphoesterase
MKFVHIGGDIRFIDGNMFLFKNAVDVVNKSTIEKLLKDPDFEVYQEATLFQEKKETKKEEKKENPDACPKCGRVIKQGKYLHAKHCKGK